MLGRTASQELIERVMENIPELIIPASSSTTSTTADEDNSWDDWSPDINCYQVSGDFPFDLHSFNFPNAITSFMAGEAETLAGENGIDDWSCPSTTTSSHATTPTPEDLNLFAYSKGPTRNELYNTEPTSTSTKDLRLIHLLMAAAEALSGDQKSPQLARVILVRLKELVPSDQSCPASGIERLAEHFAEALLALLDNPHQLHYSAGEVLTAFKSLHDMSPCVSFGQLTANQAILEATAGERRVHILDYNIAEGVQWASFIQALTSKPNTAAPHLRITAVTNGTKGSASTAQEVGRRLSAFAESVGQPFTFRICRLDQTKMFTPAAVKVVKGEALVANCVLHPAQLCSAASLTSFLTGAAALGARILTVIEEESSAEEKGFVGEFMNEIQHYMAIWESLEAGFPMQGRVREMVERVILKPRIAAAVMRAYGRQEGGEVAAERCAEWMAAVGFERVGLSFFNCCQAQLLLGLFNDGYCVDRDAPNKLALCWKSRRLLSASVWAVPPPPSPSASLPF